jgi:hypothetical protein
MGERSGWSAVVTFESDRGEPTCVRTTIDDPEPDVAARKAVFRALREGKPRKYESVVIVLTERFDPAPASADPPSVDVPQPVTT